MDSAKEIDICAYFFTEFCFNILILQDLSDFCFLLGYCSLYTLPYPLLAESEATCFIKKSVDGYIGERSAGSCPIDIYLAFLYIGK